LNAASARAAADGLFTEADRVELINGRWGDRREAAITNPHPARIRRLNALLSIALGRREVPPIRRPLVNSRHLSLPGVV